MSGHKNYEYQTNFQQATLGQNGVRVLNAGETSPEGETYVGIQALQDSVVSSGLNANSSGEIGDTSLTALPLGKGITILGRFQNVVNTSGAIYLYKG